MQKLFRLALVTLFAAGVGVAPLRAADARRPNILFIFADDHGYQAISAYNDPRQLIDTPNLDRLAKEGMRFDRCIVPNSICGPSRATVLTGNAESMPRASWSAVKVCDNDLPAPLHPCVRFRGNAVLPGELLPELIKVRVVQYIVLGAVLFEQLDRSKKRLSFTKRREVPGHRQGKFRLISRKWWSKFSICSGTAVSRLDIRPARSKKRSRRLIAIC